MKQFLLAAWAMLLFVIARPQSVGINNDGSTPHSSAALDIKSSSKGLLVPRVSLNSETDVVTIPSPQTSLLVFNTNSTLIDGAGYYYWTGSRWNKLATLNNVSNFSWGINGNSGVADSNFIGTVNNKPLVFKTNNILSGKIDPNEKNVLLGQFAGINFKSNASNNTILGHGAAVDTMFGSNNVFAGHNAGNKNTWGEENVFIGQDAGLNNTSGSRNVFVGEDAGITNKGGDNNIFIGNGAGRNLSYESNNIAIGSEALADVDVFSDDYNIAIGNKAGHSSAGTGIYIGNAAGYYGDGGIVIGDSACYGGSRYGSVAIGYKVFKNITTTNGFDVGIGYQALQNNSNGENNVALGGFSLIDNTTGDYNVAIGYNTLSQNTTGDYNTAIGTRAGLSYPNNNLVNTTALGYYAKVSTSNTMVFGDEYVNRWAFGLTTTNAQHALEVGDSFGNGNGAYLTQGGNWTNTCDANKKEDFTALDENDLLKKISKLSIQRWKYKGTNEYHIGPTAQDFYKTFGLGTDDKGISTVDPAGIALAAIQAQQKKIEMLEKEIAELKAVLKNLKN